MITNGDIKTIKFNGFARGRFFQENAQVRITNINKEENTTYVDYTIIDAKTPGLIGVRQTEELNHITWIPNT